MATTRISTVLFLLLFCMSEVSRTQCPQPTAPLMLGDLEQGPTTSNDATDSVVALGQWAYYNIGPVLMRTHGPGTTEAVLADAGPPIGVAGNRIVFRSLTFGIGATDGSAGSIVKLAPIHSIDQVHTGSGGMFLLESAGDLWFTDGTPTGTRRVLPPVGIALTISKLMASGPGGLYLTADDGVHGREIWLATPTGVTLFCETLPGSSWAPVQQLVPFRYTTSAGTSSEMYAVVGTPPAGRVYVALYQNLVPAFTLFVDSIAVYGFPSQLLIAGIGGVVALNGDFVTPLPGFCNSLDLFYLPAAWISSSGAFIHNTTGSESFYYTDARRTGIGLGQCFGVSNPAQLANAVPLRTYPSGQFGVARVSGSERLVQLGGGASLLPASVGVPTEEPVAVGQDWYHVHNSQLLRNFVPWTELAPRTNGGRPPYGTTLFSPRRATIESLVGRGLYVSEHSIWRCTGDPGGCSSLRTTTGSIGWITEAASGHWSVEDMPGGHALWSLDAFGTPSFASSLPFEVYALEGTRDGRVFGVDGQSNSLWGAVPGSGAPTSLLQLSNYWLVTVNGVAYCFAPGLQSPAALWRTDGTGSGTARIADVLAVGGAPDNPAAADGRLYFTCYGPISPEVWASDGTAAGTGRIAPGALVPNTLVEYAGQAYFSNWTGLWRSDGTAAGTILLSSHAGGVASLTPTPTGLYYFVDDFTSGLRAIWRYQIGSGSSQITVAGHGSAFANLRTVAVGDSVFFTGADAAHGAEIWYLCGSTGSVGLLGDITAQRHGAAGEAFSSNPEVLGVLAGRLVVAANDQVTGFEPWAFDLRGASGTLGGGSGDGLRVPELSSNAPRLGSSLLLRGSSAPKDPAFVALSNAGATPFGFLGLTLFLDAPSAGVAGVAFPAAGHWKFPINVPMLPVLNGVRLAAQAVFVTPTGLEATNAIAVQIGG